MSEENGSGISATIKASEGFDAPWIVIHEQDVNTLREHLLALKDSDVMALLAYVSQQFQSNFEQKPRNNKSSGGGGWKKSASTPAATQSVPAPQATTPPPTFVPNQQAQPATWGQQPQPQQLMQEHLGATVVGVEQNTAPPQVPDEVMRCYDHNGAPRKYFPAGTSRSGSQLSPSYRCEVSGCGAYWLNRDGTWKRSASR